MIKLMSFNILCEGSEEHFWLDRKDSVIHTVRNYMPDIFGLQEATPEWMDVFTENMPEYDYVGVGRDDGKRDGEFSPVFYKKDKYELLDSGNFWISKTPSVPSKSWNSKCTRICSWAKLRCIKCGKTFIALNTHLDHVSEEARSNGVRLINEFAEDKELPMVLTGDFNVYENTDCYLDMTERGIFRDAKFSAPVTENVVTYHAFQPENNKYAAVIDFVFISKEVKAKSYKVITDMTDGIFPSDHYPVLTELEIC